MNPSESIEEFYKRKFDGKAFHWLPDSLRSELGHFNLFRLEPIIPGPSKPLPYKRRDYYKIMLVKGHSQVHYADRVMEVKKQALTFSNPQIPYRWEHLDSFREGFYCIFNPHFFSQFGNIDQYEVFQPTGTHIFELSDDQLEQVSRIYERMSEELNSEYVHKYDVLRNLVFELIHLALKMKPAAGGDQRVVNASQRITTLFLELLERQFPIDSTHPSMSLRSASDFAGQLNIHVNHLNRSVKEFTQKTTSQLIGERIFQESKILLKHSVWHVADIAFSLGFTEVTHFNNFFKKHAQISPSRFRKV